MLVNIGMHQHIHILFETLGGRKGCAKITSSFNVIKPGNESTWTGYYEEIPHIKKLQDMISRTNADVNLPDSHRDSTIEDHKLQNHSKKRETFGYPRMKGVNSCGPVLNMAYQSHM